MHRAGSKYLPDIVACDIGLALAVSFSTETASAESDTLRRLYIFLYGESKLDAAEADGGEGNSKTP